MLLICSYLSFSAYGFINKYEKKLHKFGVILSNAGARALEWVRENTEKDAIILSNNRTTGSIYLIAERKGVLEGRAIYNIQSDLNMEAVNIMDDVKEFYFSPSVEILEKYNVDYVIYSPEGGLGGENILRNTEKQINLANKTFLKKVYSDNGIIIYKVCY